MTSWDRRVFAVGSLALALFFGTTIAIAEDATPPVAEPEKQAVTPKPPPISDKEVELGHTFQLLADQFALTRFARATRTETGLLFEYLPESEALDDWRTLGSLLLVPVGTSWEEGETVLPKYVDAFRRGQGEVNDIATWQSSGGAVWFMDYLVGGGSPKQHNLAAIWQPLPGTLAIFQTQRRNERFEPWQIAHFKQVASQLERAQAPAP